MKIITINLPLVELKNNSEFIIDLQYTKMNLKNAINICLVRKELIEKLLIAKSCLPKNLTFKIWDAYRPISLQEELYYMYKEKLLNNLI